MCCRHSHLRQTSLDLPRVPCWRFFWCWTFDCLFSTASFSCCLQWGGCREKMQICRLVGLRFFLANEVVSLFPPPPLSFLQTPLFFMIYFWPLQQCLVSPAAVSTLSLFNLSRHRLQIKTSCIPMKWRVMNGDQRAPGLCLLPFSGWRLMFIPAKYRISKCSCDGINLYCKLSYKHPAFVSSDI